MSVESVRVDTAQSQSKLSALKRWDVWIASGIGIFATLIYTLALAPDVLYSDSGEFQTLAYT